MPENPYRVPDPKALADAMADTSTTVEHQARVKCAGLAAGVCMMLTGFEPDAPFNAVALALLLTPQGTVSVPGTYWTSTGEIRRFEDEDALAEFRTEVIFALNEDNRDGWEPLCTVVEKNEKGTLYRLDLIWAAALPEASAQPAAVHDET